MTAARYLRAPRSALGALATILLLLVASPSALGAEAPATEAPSSLFAFRIGDLDVDFTVAGSWTASVSLGLGVLFPPDLPARVLDAFPGLATGFVFSQTPDLTLGVTLIDRYFLELAVLGGFEDNSLLLGYRGVEGELVRRVLLGTRDVTIRTTPFLAVPDQTSGSLGASALFAEAGSSTELLTRWDATSERRKLFLGSDEVEEERLGAEGWIRGRFFYLPDSAVDDLAVYLEDPAGSLVGGDGRSYRRAGYADAVLDSAVGLVSLRQAAAGRVLAFYRKGGAPIGDASLGVDGLPAETGGRRDLSQPAIQFRWGMGGYLADSDMDDRRITVDGVDCLLLWEPGDPSPFEAGSSYAVSVEVPEEAGRTRVGLESRSPSAVLPTGLSFRLLPSEERVVVYADADFRSTFRNAYPFHDLDPAASINLLYGPERDALAGLLPFVILVQTLRPVERYVLEPGVVPGSVRATVNGADEARFEVDSATGVVVFGFPVQPTDRVEVRYRTAGATSAAGDALLAWRHDVQLNERLDLWVAAGLRWSVGAAGFTNRPFEHTGTAVLGAGLEGGGAALAYSVRAAASVTDPDTAGLARLHGMEGHGISVSLSEERAWPASPGSLDPADRGKLLYRDYREYDVFGGSTLHPISWTGARAVAYADGGRPGPYLVLGSSSGSTTGSSLVLEFDLPSPASWVGAQLPLQSGAIADLSTAASVSLRLRPLGLAAGSSIQVSLELGELSEDLDADGRLDAESSPTDAGFAFNDEANAAILKIGAGPLMQGNGVRDTEDRDGDGILDPENPNRVLTTASVTFTEFSPETWTTVTSELSDSDRALLAATRGARIVVRSAAAASVGRILVDAIRITGASYWIDAPGASHASVREIAEALQAPGVDPGDGGRLEDRFPRTLGLFHADGSAQEVLEASWTGATADVKVTGWSRASAEEAPGAAGVRYDTAVAFLRVPASGILGATGISFALLDADGRGIRWSIAPADLPDAAWHELRATADGTVRLDDAVVAGASSVFDEAYGVLGRLEVTVGVSGASDGILVLDEVHLEDPRAAWGAGLAAEVSWRAPATLLAWGSVPILANVSVLQQVSASTAGFASLYGIPQAGGDLSSRTSLGFDALCARVRADVLLRGTGGTFSSSGSHRVQVPAQPSFFSLVDSFSLSSTGEFSREDAVSLRPIGGLSLDVGSSARGTDEVLTQSWTGSLDLAPFSWLAVGLDLDLRLAVEGYPLPETWYGARWVREAALLMPWVGGIDRQRWERVAGSVSLTAGLVRAEAGFTGGARSTDIAVGSRTQEDSAELSLKVILGASAGGAGGREAASGSGTRLTITGLRQLSLSGPRGAGERFAAEAASWAGQIADQDYLFLGIPVAQIFLDDSDAILARWSGVDEGRWAPTVSLAVERMPGSRVTDLIVPALVELTVGRELVREADLSANTITLKPRVAWRAINLFGRLGSAPLARFYRTDEYGISLGATVAGPSSAALGLTGLLFDFYAGFTGFGEESLTVTNAFELEDAEGSLSDRLQLAFQWSSHPAGGVPLPWLSADIVATGYLQHRETLEVTVDERPLTLLATHATTLQYPDHGSLTASLTAGFDVEAVAGGAFAYRFALRGSIQARVTF